MNKDRFLTRREKILKFLSHIINPEVKHYIDPEVTFSSKQDKDIHRWVVQLDS